MYVRDVRHGERTRIALILRRVSGFILGGQMTEKPPYLNLVEPNASSEIDQEFVPLPYFPWDKAPFSPPG